MEAVRNYTSVVDRLYKAADSPHIRIEKIGSFHADNNDYPIYVVQMGIPSAEKVETLISAGIHGDEPAGVEAALRFIEINAEHPGLLSHYHFTVFPCDNPYGWERHIRENSQGRDLNRQFNVEDPAPETAFISEYIKGRTFDLVYEMHEDYDSPGFYLYECADDPSTYLAEAIIHEVMSFGYSINRDSTIDGSSASGGIIRINTREFRETRLPKALYVYRECGGHIITMETPSTFLPIEDRVRIHLLGLNISLNRACLDKDAMAGI